jgi:hypothetical protein
MCSAVCEVSRKNSNLCIGLTGGHECSSNVEACVRQVSDCERADTQVLLHSTWRPVLEVFK